jgi:ferritin
MDESQIADVWMMFKEYLDKKHVEMAAERFVDLMADYGTSDEIFQDLLGTDKDLDAAINYYLDIDFNDNDDEEDW